MPPLLDIDFLSSQKARMTPEQREALWERFQEIDRELADLYDGKAVVASDPAIREGELLEEQDEIEFELGCDQLDCGLDG